METVRVDLERIKTLRTICIVIIGFIVGVLSGLFGVGGGILLVPALVYLLGLSQHRAHGTSLAVISLVVLASAIFYSRHGQVNWAAAAELALGGVLGAAIGARICNLLNAGRLRRYFGILLAAVGVRMLYDTAAAFALTSGPTAAGPAFSPDQLSGAVLAVGIGVATGILSGLFGVGGGIVMIPTLVLLFGFPQKLAQGVSLAVIIPVSIFGALIHTKHGNVRWEIAWWLGVGGIVGGLAGAHIAVLQVGEVVLRGLFSLLLLTVGGLMIRQRRDALTSSGE